MAGDRRAGQQQRDARGDQRAEHHQQQDQGDRHRGHLGVAEVVAHDVVDGPVDARVARLRDPQAGVSGLYRGHRALGAGHDLVGVVRIARHLERDQGGPAVTRDQPVAARRQRGAPRCQRRLDAGGHPGHALQRHGHLPDGLARLRVAGHGLPGARLDEHALRISLHHAGPAEHPFGLSGLPRVVAVEVLRPEHAADHHRAGDQHEPADERDGAVPGAPARDPLDHRGTGAGPGRRPGYGCLHEGGWVFHADLHRWLAGRTLR